MNNTTPERRNDIGFKSTITIYTSVLAILIGLFVHAAWSTASEGNGKASRNEVKIAAMEECLRGMDRNVLEIKDILKDRYGKQ